MADPTFVTITYYSEPIILPRPNFALPSGVPDNQGTWDLLGLPNLLPRLTGSPGLYSRTISGVTRLWYSLTIALTGGDATFQANFPTDVARQSALANVLTRWLEGASGLAWTAEDPAYFEDIADILGAALVRRWRADTGVTLNGSLVASWDDSVAALQLAEAVPGNQPVFQTAQPLVNDRPVILGDATLDLDSGAIPAQAQPFETFVLTIPAALTGVIFSGNAPGVSELSLAGGIASYTTDGVNVLTDPVGVAVDEPVLFASIANGGASQLQVNTRTPIQGDAGAGAPTAFIAFNDTSQANGLPQGIAEIFSTNSVTFQAARDRIWAYMTGMYRWNLSNP